MYPTISRDRSDLCTRAWTGVQAVSVNTKKGKAVISGFCCVKDNFVPHEEMKPYYPVTPSGIHVNPFRRSKAWSGLPGLPIFCCLITNPPGGVKEHPLRRGGSFIQ